MQCSHYSHVGPPKAAGICVVPFPDDEANEVVVRFCVSDFVTVITRL